LDRAAAAVILVHGRGASAGDILSLAGEFFHSNVAYLAPQAAGNTWYPFSFLASLDRNEPFLSGALDALAVLLENLAAAGLPAEPSGLDVFHQKR